MLVKFTCRVFSLGPSMSAHILAAVLIAVLLTPLAIAQEVTDIPAKRDRSAYQQDSSGNIVRSNDGFCWRAGFWEPEDAVIGCDGPLTPPVSKIIAPPLSGEPAPAATTQALPASIPTHPVAAQCEFTLTLGGDFSFAFNSDVLNASARREIEEKLLPQLKQCTRPNVIRVTGHTDRLGSVRYNQRLSLKRAQSVASYLTELGVTVPIEKIGAGASQAQAQCTDQRDKRALLDCLAPDRRISIEIQGTQN